MCSLNCPAHRTVMNWAALAFQNSGLGNISQSFLGKSVLHTAWIVSVQSQCSNSTLSSSLNFCTRISSELILGSASGSALGLLCPYAPSSFPLRAGDTQEAATCSSEPAKSNSSEKVGGFWQRRATSKHSPVSPCQKGFWYPSSCSVMIYFCSKGSFLCAY